MSHYTFVSIWQVEAPIDDVYRALEDYEQHPAWWPSVGSVTRLVEGDVDGVGGVIRYTVKSPLPYSLTFDVRIDENRAPKHLKVTASGELVGSGTWELSQEGAITTASYLWKVATTKTWMNRLALVARPIFSWAHAKVMAEGARGLAAHLGAVLLSQSSEALSKRTER